MHLLQLVNESDCKHMGAGATALSGDYITLSHCLLHTKTKEHKRKLVDRKSKTVDDSRHVECLALQICGCSKLTGI